jgi:hypothetical protein
MDNVKKVKMAAMRTAFLMEHQEITDMVELEAMALQPVVADEKDVPAPVNTESAEYLAGASDALISLITFLKQKGQR